MVAHSYSVTTSHKPQKGLERHLVRAGWIVFVATLLGWIEGEWMTWVGYGASVLLLAVGYRLTWELKQVAALRQVMSLRPRMSATELQENLNLNDSQLGKAVQKLNRECDPAAPMFVVWDHERGRLENRLAERGKVVRITSCPQCNARVGHEIDAQTEALPHCEFCDAILGESLWSELAGENDAARSSSRSASGPRRPHPRFHWLIFLALIIVLPIPFALAYAAWTTGLLEQLVDELRDHFKAHRA